MNKSELVAKAATESGVKQADVKRVLDAITNSIGNALICGDIITITGFGTCYVSSRVAESGETVNIPKFKYSKSYTEKINMQIKERESVSNSM